MWESSAFFAASWAIRSAAKCEWRPGAAADNEVEVRLHGPQVNMSSRLDMMRARSDPRLTRAIEVVTAANSELPLSLRQRRESKDPPNKLAAEKRTARKSESRRLRGSTLVWRARALSPANIALSTAFAIRQVNIGAKSRFASHSCCAGLGWAVKAPTDRLRPEPTAVSLFRPPQPAIGLAPRINEIGAVFSRVCESERSVAPGLGLGLAHA
ncbi:hypothetical protein L1887_51902 [Cichorium endivia]|nr:hypothetical protein L1887_51902 [Cichorium endivia]